MKYGQLTMGQIEAVVNKLGGMEGVQRLLAGDLMITELAERFKPMEWRRIVLGVRDSWDAYRASCESAGVIGEDLRRYFPSHKISTVPREVVLTVVSGAQLGFSRPAKRAAIIARAESVGVRTCPGEVALVLSMAYLDQPPHEVLTIATDPAQEFGETPGVFQVAAGLLSRRLIRRPSDPSALWSPEVQWVFRMMVR